MDMQPLTSSPELTAEERRRRNQQIVSKARNKLAKARSVTRPSGEEEPPLLMMSSLSGEGDSPSMVGSAPSSPSKRLLLANEKHNGVTHHSTNRGKKHSRRASASGRTNGMSSKITKALFRERRSSQGYFSKMVSSGSNDYHTSGINV